MLRVVLAVAVSFAMSGVADAAKKKVKIISKPAGASVYVGSIEAGEKCTTPCDVDVDNETTVIVELKGYRPKSEQIVIARRERAPFKRTFNLIPSVGVLKVEGPAGAQVFVEGVDKGKIPFEAEVPAGPNAVMVKLDGKEIYVNAVEIQEDEEKTITVSATQVAIKPPKDDGDNEKPDGELEQEVRQTAKPSVPRAGSLFQLSAALSVGFRNFSYSGAEGTTRNDRGTETEGGLVLAGAQLELWPGTLAGVRALRGFALVGRFQYGVNSQTVIEDDTDQSLGATTFWTSLEVSARQSFVVANTAAFDIGVGYVGDQHQFEGGENTILRVPDAYYQSLKIGARAGLLLGKVEPYAAFENRIVMSGGNLQQRFEVSGGADISGLRAALGIGMKLGNLVGRIEGSLTRYSWTIKDNGNVMDLDANGATDSIKHVSMTFGYAY